MTHSKEKWRMLTSGDVTRYWYNSGTQWDIALTPTYTAKVLPTAESFLHLSLYCTTYTNAPRAYRITYDCVYRDRNKEFKSKKWTMTFVPMLREDIDGIARSEFAYHVFQENCFLGTYGTGLLLGQCRPTLAVTSSAAIQCNILKGSIAFKDDIMPYELYILLQQAYELDPRIKWRSLYWNENCRSHDSERGRLHGRPGVLQSNTFLVWCPGWCGKPHSAGWLGQTYTPIKHHQRYVRMWGRGGYQFEKVFYEVKSDTQNDTPFGPIEG